jgi:DeoR/GlpR family transcriptional regulator of sugar metabolism
MESYGNSYSVAGHFAEDVLRQLSADRLFLAVDAFDLAFGLSTPNPEESKVNQAMVQNCVREKYSSLIRTNSAAKPIAHLAALSDR